MVRTLGQIAWDIRGDWKKIHYAARPYLDAMQDLVTIHDMYGYDSARSIVLYFLNNAKTWRGEKAKAIKAELKKLIKQSYL